MKKKLLFSALFWYFSLLSLSLDAQWSQKANIGGSARSHSVGFGIGTKGYVCGGYDGSSSYRTDLWEYDPSTDAWTQKANFGGVGRQWATGISIGSKGYVGTGLSGAGVFLNDFWEYDPSTNVWTQKANFAGQARELATGFSIGSKGYIGTGYYNVNFTSYEYNDLWEYDPSLDHWTAKASMGGVVRSGAVGFSIGSKGYIGTGEGLGNYPDFKNDFWEYDPSIDQWTQKANFPGGARRIAVGFGFGGKGYLGTGHVASYVFKKDFWEYDPAAGWSQKADVGGQVRSTAIGFSIGSKGYIGAGLDDYFTTNVLNDFYEYDPTVSPVLNIGSLGASSYCTSTSVTVPYSSAGIVFYSGNVFTAQLSNASGSFASPTNIGTLTSIAGSGNISATIPYVAGGSGYRIRVVSSSPVYNSASNGTNLVVTPPYSTGYFGGWDGPTISTGSEQYLSTDWVTGYSFDWSVTSAPDPYSYAFDPGGLPVASGSQVDFYAFQPGYYTVQLQVSGTCGTSYLYTSIEARYPWDFRYAVSPNPASSNITIMQNLKSKNQKTVPLSGISITQVSVFDNFGNLKKQVRYGAGTLQVQLNVSDLKTGIYYVEISNGKETERQKILIQRD
jgi:hypothetical protein